MEALYSSNDMVMVIIRLRSFKGLLMDWSAGWKGWTSSYISKIGLQRGAG